MHALRSAIAILPLALGAFAATERQSEMTHKWATLDGKPPLVIAHRGASGYRPEHTLEAYALAIDQGADVIEPDLVFTKDGVLVARHDRYLSTSTDVAGHPEFASRQRANNDPNDAPRIDWWVEDFTLAEMKTLRARQAFPGRSKEFDGLYEIPTFDEVIDLVQRKSVEAKRKVGVYPETKHASFFASIGMDFEKPLLDALAKFDAGPVFIQSFEPEILKRLKGKTNAKLVQLVEGANSPSLSVIASYADGIGAAKDLITTGDGDSGYVRAVHAAGLFVHAWTFRDDAQRIFTRESASRNYSMRYDGQSTPMVSNFELLFDMALGIDGAFTDFPDSGLKTREHLACAPLSQTHPETDRAPDSGLRRNERG